MCFLLGDFGTHSAMDRIRIHQTSGGLILVRIFDHEALAAVTYGGVLKFGVPQGTSQSSICKWIFHSKPSILRVPPWPWTPPPPSADVCERGRACALDAGAP